MSTLKNPHVPAALAAATETGIRAALAEDVGSGDLTGLLVPAGQQASAQVIVREQAVLCGAPWFEDVMQRVDAGICISWRYAEGDLMAAGSTVCTIDGPARAHCLLPTVLR